jgi:hypothetical protein
MPLDEKFSEPDADIVGVAKSLGLTVRETNDVGPFTLRVQSLLWL